MSTEIEASFLSRIQKLMARTTERGATEAEAQTASDMIARMLADRNIDMAQIEAASGTGSTEKRGKTAHNRSAMYEYQRTLMKALAENNFCLHFIEERTKEDPRARYGTRQVKTHVLLGRKMNIDVTMMTYDYLTDTMDRLLPWQGMEKRGKNALLWLAGCTDRLVDRLRIQTRERQQEDARRAREAAATARHPGAAGAGTGLVLADVYSSEADYNNDALYGWEPGTTAEKRRLAAIKEANRQAEREANRLAILAERPDIDPNVLDFMLWGWTFEDATARAEKYYAPAKVDPKPMTARQLLEQEKRRQRYESDAYRRQSKLDAKIYSPAYQAGRETGGNIGLDKQVGKDSRAAITKE